MTLSLLLDLDGTLLENEIETFLPRYLQAFTQFIAPHNSPQAFVEGLLSGTQKMTHNQKPDCTLKEVFEEIFYSKVELGRQSFEPLAEQFYSQVFPSLKELTRPVPGARDFVQSSVDRGYEISIATNPLFPLTAIEQRLSWAGLDSDRYPFKQITAYDQYHFAKPDPAYFAELLAHLRWPEDGVIMVGNDLKRDISGAGKLGLPTFWLQNDGISGEADPERPTGRGRIDEILPWLDTLPSGELQPDYSSVTALLATLRSTPAFLDTVCRNLDAEFWGHSPRENAWGLTEVICHLRDVDAEVNLFRLKKVRDEDNPFLPSEDTDTWAKTRSYALQDGSKALRQFMIIRSRLVEVLESLEPHVWQRKARHAIFGPTDLHELVVIIAGHDRLHVRQIHEIIDSLKK